MEYQQCGNWLNNGSATLLGHSYWAPVVLGLQCYGLHSCCLRTVPGDATCTPVCCRHLWGQLWAFLIFLCSQQLCSAHVDGVCLCLIPRCPRLQVCSLHAADDIWFDIVIGKQTGCMLDWLIVVMCPYIWLTLSLYVLWRCRIYRVSHIAIPFLLMFSDHMDFPICVWMYATAWAYELGPINNMSSCASS